MRQQRSARKVSVRNGADSISFGIEEIDKLRAEHDTLRAENARLAKRVEKLEAGMREFSKQKLSDEMDEESHDNADFEGAYEHFVLKSRAMLAAVQGRGEMV